MPTRTFDASPSMLPLYAKSVAPAVPGLGLLPGVRRTARELPDLELVRPGVRIDRDHLAAYAEVCGFSLGDVIPSTLPHVLAFPLHLKLMTDGGFPFAPMGIVHVANRIEQRRPIRSGEVLDLSVHAADLRPHAKGRQFDLVTEASVGPEQVWREVSTMLRRGGGDPALGQPDERSLPRGATRWRLAADLGRRYAAVSGDHNPIHLYGPTAKVFGFSRQIAHGMWSKARCLAALEPRLDASFDVRVEFKKPILLPGTVAFGTRPGDGDVLEFGLSGATSQAPHVLGSVGPLTG